MRLLILAVVFFVFHASVSDCSSSTTGAKTTSKTTGSPIQKDLSGYSKAYFASGCFWCVEAIFESVKGVEEVVSGYSGGSAADANYPTVSAGKSNHAEAVEVYYDSTQVDFNTLLLVFYDSHDPTTLNQQGADKGRQYRSAIFYQNETEKRLAKQYIKQLLESGTFPSISTTLEPFEKFYPAEDYHQDYERRNPNHPYIRSVSIPRLKRFQQKQPKLLKVGGVR